MEWHARVLWSTVEYRGVPETTVEYPSQVDAAYLTCEAMICYGCALPAYPRATLEYPKSTPECALPAYPRATLNAAIVNASEHRRGYPRRATRCNHDMAYIRKRERLKWD